MVIKKRGGITLITVLLAACGGGDELPPERADAPPAVSASDLLQSTVTNGVSGRAVDGTVVNGTITIYSFANGIKGVRLGNATTDHNGAFSITFTAATQPLLIELSGGYYVEDSSGVVVNLKEGQVLKSLILYNEGDALSSMVTPLTHMAAALAEYKINKGVAVNDAITQAHVALAEAFGFDVTTTTARNINDASMATRVASSSYRYGFLLAGLSSWTQWVSEQNRAEIHTTYTAVGLSQVIYNDLASDGILDGRGYNKARSALMDLALGVVPITADLYRYGLPQHMLVMAASDRNRTALTVNDLRSSALAMTTSNAAIIGSSNSRTNTISLITSEASDAICGATTFEIDFGGAVIVERARFSIDGNFEGEVQPYTSLVKVGIDTSQYAAGQHQLAVNVTDVLGQRYESVFLVDIEAAPPVVLPPSQRVTNQENALLEGFYCNSGAEITSIVVQGEPAILSGGGWRANVTLAEGINGVQITATDAEGRVFINNAWVALDTTAPIIDTNFRHGVALFSQGDGSFEGPLEMEDTNATPLYLETTRLALHGVPVRSTSLIVNQIPYFGFSVNDPLAPVGSAAKDVVARMQYEVDGEVKLSWRELVASVDNGSYLIPLVADYLLPFEWLQTVPANQHTLRIQVEDAAGNVAETAFTFFAEFYVPEIVVNDVGEVTSSAFNSTVFANRDELYGAEIDVMQYRFTNDTDRAFYIELNDSSSHTVSQTIDEMERVHWLDSTTTATEWQIGYLDVSGTCTAQPSWQLVDSVLNWNGFSWVQEFRPAPLISNTPVSIESDNLVETSAWQDVPHFDEEHFLVESDVFGNSYIYDYVMGTTVPDRYSSAFITNWAQPASIACGDIRNFQARTVSTHVSREGYPRNEFRSLTLPQQLFSTTDIRLINNSTGNEIAPYLGATGEWYRVPAGSTVTAIKRVTTPALPLYNDVGVAADNTAFNSYEPQRLDQEINWSIDGLLEITAAHDAGESNLLAMPTTAGSIATAEKNYLLSR